MSTWLDYYIQGALDNLPATIRPFLNNETDADAMFWLIVQGLSAPPVEDQTALRYQYCAMLPLVARATGHSMSESVLPSMDSVVAVQVSEDLIEDFARATAPQTDAWQASMLSATWYIDIPHRSLLVGDRQVRAVFTQGSRFGQLMVVAIVTEVGSNKLAGRLAWVLDDPSPVLGLAMPDVDVEYLRESLDNLIKLIALYRMTGSGGDLLPIISTRQLSRLPLHKQRARQKTVSLFRVTRLVSPPGRFGREHETGGRSWTLTHRVPARGHFRWQAWGERHSLRRLQWIAAHWRGPEIEDNKTRLERLD